MLRGKTAREPSEVLIPHAAVWIVGGGEREIHALPMLFKNDIKTLAA